MTLTYVLGPDDLEAFYHCYVRRSRFIQEAVVKQRRNATFVFFAFMVVVAWALRSWPVVVGALVGTGIYWGIFRQDFYRRVVKSMQRHDEMERHTCAGRVHRLAIAKEGLTCSCDSCNTTLEWKTIKEVVRSTERVVVLTDASRGTVFNRKSVTEGDFDAFSLALAARTGPVAQKAN